MVLLEKHVFLKNVDSLHSKHQYKEGSRNSAKVFWQSLILVHELLSLFHSFHSLQGSESFPTADNLFFLFLGFWNLGTLCVFGDGGGF